LTQKEFLHPGFSRACFNFYDVSYVYFGTSSSEIFRAPAGSELKQTARNEKGSDYDLWMAGKNHLQGHGTYFGNFGFFRKQKYSIDASLLAKLESATFVKPLAPWR
jgi:hypothetical protein